MLNRINLEFGKDLNSGSKACKQLSKFEFYRTIMMNLIGKFIGVS